MEAPGSTPSFLIPSLLCDDMQMNSSEIKAFPHWASFKEIMWDWPYYLSEVLPISFETRFLAKPSKGIELHSDLFSYISEM